MKKCEVSRSPLLVIIICAQLIQVDYMEEHSCRLYPKFLIFINEVLVNIFTSMAISEVQWFIYDLCPKINKNDSFLSWVYS